jgi:hypothetical protein
LIFETPALFKSEGTKKESTQACRNVTGIHIS